MEKISTISIHFSIHVSLDRLKSKIEAIQLLEKVFTEKNVKKKNKNFIIKSVYPLQCIKSKVNRY